LEGKKLYIDNDLTKKERDVQKKSRNCENEERARRPSEDRLQETNGQRKDFHMEGRGRTEFFQNRQSPANPITQ